MFELTSDNSLDNVDLEVWLSLAGLENLSSRKAYLPGDANLDGKVNSTDLNVVRANWLDSVTGWCSGDFTTNGVVNANDLNEVGLNWLQDVSGAAPRMPRAAFTGHVGYLMRRLVPDAYVQNANQYTAPNQIVSIRVDAEKPIDQVMRRRFGRQTGTSESRASGHHFGRELTAIDQHVDSVFRIWDSQ